MPYLKFNIILQDERNQAMITNLWLRMVRQFYLIHFLSIFFCINKNVVWINVSVLCQSVFYADAYTLLCNT